MFGNFLHDCKIFLSLGGVNTNISIYIFFNLLNKVLLKIERIDDVLMRLKSYNICISDNIIFEIYECL